MRKQASPPDPRWQVLSDVQTAREALGLKARSLTVLRGLLSLISPQNWDLGELRVFASNRVLQERCDGMDERTLRRHLQHLCGAGLIERHLSPNRKRYQLRDETGLPVVSYGFDLRALKLGAARLAALAEEAQRLATRLKALKAVLRHLLWQAGVDSPEHRRLLRNKSDAAELTAAIDALRLELGAKTSVLTDSHGQIDRDIQRSNKEYYEENSATEAQTPTAEPNLTLRECIEAAPEAMELALEPIRNWQDLDALAHSLSSGLGLAEADRQAAQTSLGRRGYTLAVLGMVQAMHRIRHLPNYFASLQRQAREGRLNLRRMYLSLTRSARFPAGNRRAHAL